MAPDVMSIASTLPDAMICRTCQRPGRAYALGGSFQATRIIFRQFFQNLLSGSRFQHRRVLPLPCMELSCCCRFYWSQRFHRLSHGRGLCAPALCRRQPRECAHRAAAASRAKRAKYSGAISGITSRSPSRLGKPAWALALSAESTPVSSGEWKERLGERAIAPMICTLVFFRSAATSAGRMSPKIVPSSE